MQGVLRKGQEVEIRPGIVSKDGEGRTVCTPIFSRIMTLLAESNELQYAVPGGLIGVGTTVSWECGVEACMRVCMAAAKGVFFCMLALLLHASLKLCPQQCCHILGTQWAQQGAAAHSHAMWGRSSRTDSHDPLRK